MWAGTALLAWSQTRTNCGSARSRPMRVKGGGSSPVSRAASNHGCGRAHELLRRSGGLNRRSRRIAGAVYGAQT